MNKKRLIMIIGILLILGGWGESVLGEELKIGVVDMRRAITESQAGKDAKKLVSKEVERIQRLNAEKQKELQTMKESLDKQGPMLSLEARTSKEKEYQTKLRDFQRWGEDSQNEINQKGMEMERTIALGLQKVIQKLGEEEGYTVILEKNEMIVLYGSKAIDLTDRVTKLFDAQKK